MSIKNNKSQLDLTKLDFANKELAESIAREVLKKMNENPGMTLKDATGISDQALEEIYSLAYTFYNQGKYKESISLFEFLTGSCPKTYKYVLGLAASYHQIKAYKEAAVGFYIALNLQPENPIPAYYAADSFLKEQLHEEAIECAEAAIEICEGQSEYAELKERCILIIDSLKSKK